jgi:putative Ca2+/H+ antiporter (TMEM165/GDT1 family)
MHVTMNLWIVVVLALFSAECYAFQARQLPSLRRTHSTASAPKSHFTLTPSLSTRTISASASKLHLRKEDNKESTEGLSEYSSFIQSSSFKKGCVLAGSMLAAICLFQQSAFAAPAVLDKLQQSANDGGFVQAFLLIFISEIGDKTFFIAALLAAKYGRFISFAGSVGALAVMTVISTVLGQIFHAVPASITQGIPFDDVVAVIAFTYFGLKTLVDASKLEDTDNSGIEEEKEEAEKSVESLEDKRKSTIAIFVQIFSLVFAAEIGDR